MATMPPMQPPQGAATDPQQQQQPQDGSNVSGTQDDTPGTQDESNVSPEEQQTYDTVVKKAADLIYGDGKVSPDILNGLMPAKAAPTAASPDTEEGNQPGQTKGNPAVLALAHVATAVIQKLDTTSQAQGFHIPDDILYHAGAEVIEMLAEIAQVAKIHDYSETELQGAVFQTIDNYRPIAERLGRANPDELKEQFSQIVQADQQGELDKLLPGLKSQAQPDQTQGQQPGPVDNSN